MHSIISNRPRSILSPVLPRLRWAALPLGALLLAGTATAFVTNVAGMAVLIANPPSVKPGALVDADIHTFNEVQNVILPVDITLDAAPGAEIKQPADVTQFVLPRGTCIKSHYIHYEPGVTSTANGGVRFDSPILGVALLQSSLDATNFLGAFPPPTDYPVALQCAGGGVDCGMELPDDLLRVNPQGVEVEFFAENPGDRVRVITQGNPAICKPLCRDLQCD